MSETQNAAAARLTMELGFPVTRKMVRVWQSKDYDLHDLVALKSVLRNQERSSLPADLPTLDDVPDVDLPNDKPLTPEAITKEIQKLERQLLTAPDYETARKIKTQISGMNEMLKVQKELGVLIPAADAIKAGAVAATASRQAWEGIEDELPPMLEGLTAAQMKAKLRDFARSKCKELADVFA